ncbi:hypothetical protein [Spirulina sp. 06S082]|uniref:hypothetical protein n=1 Tax=Spirulina sp. 06S082 TaxID=3110248 RepID=UPI002B1FA918|nr:hypothetical protein [Spirulina sp. 06S082]MEA5467358.1 hypothetical protein [Spirulina sp. 06S082]
MGRASDIETYHKLANTDFAPVFTILILVSVSILVIGDRVWLICREGDRLSRLLTLLRVLDVTIEELN